MQGLEGKPLDAMGFQVHVIQAADFATYRKVHADTVNRKEQQTAQWLELRETLAASSAEENSKWQQLLRLGVPLGQRHWVWAHLCGARERREQNPGTYRDLVERSRIELKEDPIAYYIDVDLPRTFSGA